MKKDYSFSSLGSLIAKYSKNIDIERGLRETALKNIWADIVGDVFRDNTKLMGVKTSTNGDLLLIAAKSSIVCQEFLIHKRQILKKIALSAYSLGFNVYDIAINTKHWSEINQEINQYINNSSYNVFTGVPTKVELDQINLPEGLISSLHSTINETINSNEEIRLKLIETAVRDIKTQIWRKNKGFPSCIKCGITVSCFKTGEDILCPSCKYND